MSTPILRPTVAVDVNGDIHEPEGGNVKLDMTTAPYATSVIELELLDDEDLEWLNPANGVRVPFVCGAHGTNLRPFDLSLRSRVVSHDRKRVTLRLSSDEALLMKYRALTLDKGARAHQASLRAVCNYVLGMIGAALEPGSDDADVTAYWPLTNILPNPSAQGTVGTYFIAAGNVPSASIALDNQGSPPYGSTSVLWLSSAAGWASLSLRQHTARPGDMMTASAYVRQINNLPVRIRFNWRDSENELIRSDVGAAVNADSTWNARPYITAKAPAGTARVGVILEFQSTAGGQGCRADGMMLYKGDELVPYHDGANTPAGYLTAWTDAANASQSTRTPFVERLPELFVWQPGQTAWDFLLTITAVAGFVLWCDEERRWWLARPEDRAVAGLVNVAPTTTRRGEDELSDESDEAAITGVVVRYRWRDLEGTQHEAYDSAGTPENVLVVELDKAYPGPGIAAGMLARRSGTGRVQRVDVLARWNTTPGMTAQIALPGAPPTIGRVTDVNFDLRLGLMGLGTTGLIDVSPGDWLALDADLDWDDVNPALDWKDA